MKKFIVFMLSLMLVFSSMQGLVFAAPKTITEKIIDSWQGDGELVPFIESWYESEKGLKGDALMEYLEADYDYIIPFSEVEFDDIKGLDFENAIKLLGKLGIVTGREEGKYFPEASLTRAEMVTILLRVFGQEEYTGDFKFDDVTDAHWAYKNVMMAYGMKIVNGTSETTFSPDLALTYEQAVKMLVSAFGYDADAIELGGWPKGYIAQAEKMGFLGTTKPENTASEINRGTMAQLLANAIEVEEYAIDYVDPYRKEIALKNQEALVSFDVPMIKKDRTVVNPSADCNEWDTMAVLSCKSDGKTVGAVIQDYIGGDKSLRNKEAWKLADEQKLRMVYGMQPEVEIYNYESGDAIVDTGINLVCMTFGGGTEKYDRFTNVEEILDTLDKYCEERPGVKIVISQHCGTGKNNTLYGQFNTGTSTLFTKTPCPLSEEYWKVQCFEKFAAIATHPSVYAIGFDWEMYGADSTHFPGSCYCDTCYNDFFVTRGYENEKELIETEASVRKAALTNAGLVSEYDWYQKEKLVSMLQKWVKALHDINPNLVLGYLPQFEEIKGITRGIGTPEMPAICFDEITYWGGIYDFLDNLEVYKNQGIPVCWMTGLWSDPVTPEDLTKHIEEISYHTDGYWIYAAQYFKKDANHSYEAIDGVERSGELYLEALTKGNSLIDDFLKTGREVPKPFLPSPEYECAKVSGEPTEADWAKAPYTASFMHPARNRRSTTIDSRAQLLWDGKNMYVRITNDEKYMESIATQTKFDRDGLIRSGQEVNDVLWAFPDSREAVHIYSNKDACSIYDAYVNNGSEDSSKNWDDVTVKCEISEDEKGTPQWIMTFKVPLTVDGETYAKEGDMIKVLLYRSRSHSSDTNPLVWSATTNAYMGAGLLTEANMKKWSNVTLK